VNLKKENIIAVRSAKTIYRDGDSVIKLFADGYSKADILNEALNQSRVEETGLRIPRLLEVAKTGNSWAIVMDYIAGRTLEQYIKEDITKRDQYLDLFVNLQMEVHSKHAPLLNKLQDKMQRKISQSPLDATTRYELYTRLDSMPKHVKVCHGDFNPSNIILADSGEAYIIDWSHATQGNASADIARSYLLFCLSGDEEAAEKYLSLFCKKSDTAKQYVQKWMPIVAASQMVKGKTGEYDFLKRWTDVVEYE
jgi:thiamine kinase-like enzyme